MSRRIAVLEVESVTGESGGAERLTAGVRESLRLAGMTAERVTVPADERSFDGIREAYLRCYDLDLSRFDGVVSMKAPTYVARHPNHVCYLMHTMRAFYDVFDVAFPRPSTADFERRRLIHALDTAAMMRLRAVYAIGNEVAQRLYRYNGLGTRVLRPPSPLTGLHTGGRRHFFLPGRLHAWKRVDLAIQAMQFIEGPIELLVSGTGAEEQRLRRMAAGDERIRFLGHVSDAQLTDFYADSLAVLFVPRGEDLGLVTLEAFHCEKPVVTCTDSGEPAQIVCDGRSGFICAPDARAVAVRLDELARAPERAAEMGRYGKASIASMTWDKVAAVLLSGLGFDNPGNKLGLAA